MENLHALRLLSLAGLGTLLAASAFAQDSGNFYGGVGLGQSRARIDEARITSSLQGAGLSTSGMTSDESSTAFKLFGGYQFNRNFALEGGYFNLGKFGFRSSTVPGGTLSGEIKVQGLNLDLVGTLPLTDRFALIGRAGMQYAHSRDSFSGTGAVSVLDPSPSKSEANYKLGVGLQYAISPAVLLRGEAERYRINDAVGNRGDVNVFSLALVFPFGRAAEPAHVAAAPAYVEPPPPAPAAEPVVVVAEPVEPVVHTPDRRRVHFSAETLFTFDQSALRPEGRAALDAFAAELKGSRFEQITVVGHADRLGSDAYNQTLSMQRAEIVKTYLTSTHGFNPAKISAVGQGESEPVTLPEACKGRKPTAKLIACLQPDRGAEIEVTGSKRN